MRGAIITAVCLVALAGCGDSRRWEAWRQVDGVSGPAQNFATERECRDYLQTESHGWHSYKLADLGYFCRPQ